MVRWRTAMTAADACQPVACLGAGTGALDSGRDRNTGEITRINVLERPAEPPDRGARAADDHHWVIDHAAKPPSTSSAVPVM